MVLALAVAALAAYAVFLRPPERPSVILISIDSLRPDHLGCYGYARPTSPTLDRLAARGALFEVVTSSSSWTLPAHAALFTGLPDRVHGCYDETRWLARNRQTLAEAFQAAGYRTVGFFAGPFLHPGFGFGQGFDAYHDCTSYSSRTIADLQADRVPEGWVERSHRDVTNEIVLGQVDRWFAEHQDTPFFAFIHLWDVHYDYIPPPPYHTMFDPDYQGPVDGKNVLDVFRKPASWTARDVAHLEALYDGEIRWTDDTLEKILARLRDRGLLENTIVAVTADHGEAFYEHGIHGHRHTLYEEEIRVPLVIHHPRSVPAGTRIPHPVELIDVGPTLLDQAGVAPLAHGLGRSLVPLLRDPLAPWKEHRAVVEFEEEASGTHLFALRTPAWKLIVDLVQGRHEVFDLVQDAREISPLPEASYPLPEAEMKKLYAETARTLQRAAEKLPAPGERDTPKIGKMTEAQLRSLGYLK